MKIKATPEIVSELKALQASEKFTEEDFYPGAPTEEIRSSCEGRVNDFIGDVLALLAAEADREDIFSRARVLTQTFEEEDTEEREKVDDYIGETMALLGIEDWTDHL